MPKELYPGHNDYLNRKDLRERVKQRKEEAAELARQEAIDQAVKATVRRAIGPSSGIDTTVINVNQG